MPVPLLLAAPAIASAGASIMAWANSFALLYTFQSLLQSFVDSQLFRDILHEGFNPIIRDLVFEKTGIQLDPIEPLTKQSISSGISNRVGIPLTDLSDAEQTKSDVGAYVTTQINGKLGIDLPNLYGTSTADLRTAMEGELVIAIQSALVNGSHPMISSATIGMIADYVAAARGMIVDGDPPASPDEELDAKRLRNRLAQRKWYLAQKLAGGTRVYQFP